MAEEVIHNLGSLKLTTEEEEVIAISDEGRQEEIESCSQSLIGKLLTCKPFNKRAAQSTLKRAWGLENKVQVVEVGANLFQFKFQTEFDMERVLRDGPWTFDNQILLLVRWKAGMTAGNVKFESASLWVQIWGAPFDMVSPKVAEEIGNRLGIVEEVEKRSKQDIPGFFMRVKVAIPLAKPIRRGAFLADSGGQRSWVTFKYERLTLFCYHCGLLGHDLKHCAKYFAVTKGKGNGEVEHQYGEWLKASGSRVRSPNRRGQAREMEDHGDVERETVREMMNRGGGRGMPDRRDGDDKGINDENDKEINEGNVSIGTAPEILPANPVKRGKQSTEIDKLKGVDGPCMNGLDAGAGPLNEGGKNKLQGNEKQRTWTRLVRMDHGPMEAAKESSTQILGKRSHHAQQQQVSSLILDEQVGKKAKTGNATQTTETVGVSEHPRRTQ